MKVLTIQEPWASLILSGKKTIETRTWKTNYRGPVLLHASKSPKSDISGKAFAFAKIVDCKTMTKEHENEAMCEIYPKANSWFLGQVFAIHPFEMKGQLGLMDLPKEIEDKIRFKLKLVKNESP